jgi:hypothetical protein
MYRQTQLLYCVYVPSNTTLILCICTVKHNSYTVYMYHQTQLLYCVYVPSNTTVILCVYVPSNTTVILCICTVKHNCYTVYMYRQTQPLYCVYVPSNTTVILCGVCSLALSNTFRPLLGHHQAFLVVCYFSTLLYHFTLAYPIAV